MDCKEFREKLDLYVDGELAAEATSAAQFHERECPSCQRAAAALMSLRRQIKSEVARHQLPPELVHAVQRIPQTAWKRLLGISDLRRTPGISPRHSFSVLRKNFTVPLPVLALLLVAVTLGAWFVSRRTAKVPAPLPNTQLVWTTQVGGQPPNGDAMNFSRFDHGQRAFIYKTRR